MKYGNEFTISKCKDKGCSLKDISSQDYFIVDGDKIKKSGAKSVDCIIIDLKKIKAKESRIILCELTKGTKELKEAVEKFKSSGELITTYLNDIDESVYSIDCLLLGNIVKNGKVIDKKQLLNKFYIEGFDKATMVQNENCGFSIKQLKNT